MYTTNKETTNIQESENTINKDAATGAYLVCLGATCKCSAGALPFINLPITSQSKVFAQNKLVGTVNDAQLPPVPFAVCSLNPDKINGQPCLYTNPGTWDIKADAIHPLIDGKLLLTDNAQMKCPKFPNGLLSIVTHGQTINVGDTSTEEVDDIAYTISPLSDPVKEETQTKNLSVSSIEYNGKKSNSKTKKEKIQVRAGELVTITTSNTDKTSQFIHWSVWLNEKETDGTAPTDLKTCQVYENYGHRINLSLKKGESLFIEAFGTKVENRNKVYPSCMLWIEGAENEIKDISNLKGLEKLNDGYIAKVKTDISFEIPCKFGNYKKEELELLQVIIKDSEKNILKSFTNLNLITIEKSVIENEGTYFIEVKYKENCKTYRLETYSNFITTITPNLKKTRIKEEKEFKIGLKDTKQNLEPERLKWEITNKTKEVVANGTGTTIKYNFPVEGKYKITAKYDNKFDFILLKSKLVSEITTEAIRNHPDSITMAEKGYLGAPTQIEIKTVLENYWSDVDGGVDWEINFTPKEGTDLSEEIGRIVSADLSDNSSKWNKDVTVTTNSYKFTGGNTLLFIPLCIGKFEIIAGMNGKTCTKKIYEVKNGEVVSWTFVNDFGHRLSKIGWKQNFRACIHVKGWNKQTVDVCLYYKIKINKKVKLTALATSLLPAYLLMRDYYTKSIYKKTLILNEDGYGVCEIGTEDFWKQIIENKYYTPLGIDLELGKNADFYLAIEKSPSLYVYNSLDTLKTDNEKDVLLNNLIAPVENQGLLRHSIYLDEEKTTYEAMFQENDQSKLTRVVQYGEEVRLALQVYCAKGFDLNRYKYKFNLIENLENEDREVTFDPSKQIIEFDESFKSRCLLLNTGTFPGKNTHEQDKGTAYNPRCYYLIVYRALADKDKWEPILYYPDGYNNTGLFQSSAEKVNDQYIPLLRVDDPIIIAALKSAECVNDLEREEWEKEGKNVEEEIEKRKEAIRNYLNPEETVNAANRKEIEKLDKNKRQNYFLQLKVAKETSLNKSLKEIISAIMIGEALSCTKENNSICFCKQNNFAWSGKLTCEERKKVLSVCAELWGEENKLEKANQLMSVMHIESGFDPKADNGKGYVGLIQFSKPAAESVGTTQADLLKMSFIQQMDYVKKYLEKQKDKLSTRTDLYLLVMKPNAVGNGNNPNYAIFDESIEDIASPERSIWRDPWVKKYGYASNPIFMFEDEEKILRKRKRFDGTEKEMYGFIDGKTYVWEVDKVIEEHYQKGLINKFRGKCIHQTNEFNSNRAPWMQIALEEFNTHKGVRQKQSPLKERISEYFNTTSYKGTYKDSWCGAFISFCFNKTNGYENTNYKGAGAAYDWLPPAEAKAKRDDIDGWIDGELITKSEDVFYGCVIVFSYSHVAFIVGQSEDGNSFIYLGGNQSDGEEGDSSGNRVICTNPKLKTGINSQFWIVKPKNYIPTEDEKNLPYISADGKELNYDTTH